MSCCYLQEKGKRNHWLAEKDMTSYYFLKVLSKKSHYLEVLDMMMKLLMEMGTNWYLEVEDMKNYYCFRVLGKMIHLMVQGTLSFLVEMDTTNHLYFEELDTTYVQGSKNLYLQVQDKKMKALQVYYKLESDLLSELDIMDDKSLAWIISDSVVGFTMAMENFYHLHLYIV